MRPSEAWSSVQGAAVDTADQARWLTDYVAASARQLMGSVASATAASVLLTANAMPDGTDAQAERNGWATAGNFKNTSQKASKRANSTLLFQLTATLGEVQRSEGEEMGKPLVQRKTCYYV